MTKPFSHLPAKGETKAQALTRLTNWSRCGALTQIFIVGALSEAFGDLEYAARETNEHKIKQALKFAPAKAIQAVEGKAKAVQAAGVEGVRAAFEKANNGMIHPDAWFRVGEEIAQTLAACKDA